MTVSLDCDGTHVGTVDKVEGGHLKILRPDQRPRNQHQYVTPNWIVAVDDRVRLNLTLDEAKRLWATEPYAKRHDLHRPKWQPETTPLVDVDVGRPFGSAARF